MNFLANLNWGSYWYNNTLSQYAWALAIFFILIIVFKLIKNKLWFRLEKISKHSKTDIDDKLVKMGESIHFSFYAISALWLSSRLLNLDILILNIINILFIIVIFNQLTIFLQALLKYWVEKKVENKAEIANIFSLLSVSLKIILWLLALLLILSNLGININSLIAGLGIGGIAIALAAQSLLSDIFASITIYFDKPFKVGDFIVLDDNETMGTVEKIGFKTTRLRALNGEEIIITNSDLLAHKIHNYKGMKKRRVVINFGVVYSTSQEKMKQIPYLVKNIIDDIPEIDFSRAHFKEFGDSALIFEVVYFVATGDYNAYMDYNQTLHLRLKEKFEQEKIAMAFPTQTIYLNK